MEQLEAHEMSKPLQGTYPSFGSGALVAHWWPQALFAPGPLTLAPKTDPGTN